MTGELSAGDIMALSRENNDGCWNNPFIYFVWLALLGGGNGFGGWGNSAMQGALTRAEMYDGLNNQTIQAKLDEITAANTNGFFGVQSGIAENRFTNQQCCCEIKTAIHEEAEATRALINANTMQDLRDKLEDRDRELRAAQLQISQNVQTSNIVNALKPSPVPAYITASPYVAVNGYGCGCTV